MDVVGRPVSFEHPRRKPGAFGFEPLCHRELGCSRGAAGELRRLGRDALVAQLQVPWTRLRMTRHALKSYEMLAKNEALEDLAACKAIFEKRKKRCKTARSEVAEAFPFPRALHARCAAGWPGVTETVTGRQLSVLDST